VEDGGAGGFDMFEGGLGSSKSEDVSIHDLAELYY
jgi:hypothetical protein